MMSCQIDQDLSKAYLSIKMLGVYESPATAFENGYEPIYHVYTLKDVTLTTSDGESRSVLEKDWPTEYRIVNRSQIIFQKELLSTDVGTVYHSISISFDKSVKGASKYKSDHTFELSTSEISYSSPFTVEKAQGLTFVIKVKWKSTVSRNEEVQTDTMVKPEFEISFTKS